MMMRINIRLIGNVLIKISEYNMKIIIKKIITIICFIVSQLVLEAQNGQLVTGIDMPKLIEACVSGLPYKNSTVTISKSGLSYRFGEGKAKASITVGVFINGQEASNRFREDVYHTSIGPEEQNFADQPGDEVAVWKGRRILFRRDNTLVNLYVRDESGLQVARAIDKSLVDGINGVTRDDTIKIPQIVDFAMQGARVEALTEPRMEGYSAAIDQMGYSSDFSQVTAIIFATKHCVMAKPFKCDREELKRKMELWKAQEEEKRRAPEAVVKKHLETLASGNLDFEARKEAILLLGASKDKRAEPVLIAELDRLDRDPAPNPVLRCLAVRALGMLRTPKAATRIAAILSAPPVGNVEDDDGSEEEYRREAVFALRLIGGETARNAFETVVKAPREYRSVRETAGNALRNMK